MPNQNYRREADALGQFGQFGGRFVAESLMPYATHRPSGDQAMPFSLVKNRPRRPRSNTFRLRVTRSTRISSHR